MLALFQREPQQARKTIDSLSYLFEQYDIPATWAIVGHLFFDSSEVKEVVHPEIPQIEEGWLDWDFYQSLNDNPLCYYGKDIVAKILASSVKHEIGLHSFSHIPFSECSQKVAEAEVELGMKAARRFGVIPKSFVFPDNYVGHVDVLRNCGLQIYRGKDTGRWDKAQGFLIRKINGAIDKLFVPPVLPSWQDGIWEIRSSMYFCDPQMPFTLLPRAKLGLSKATRADKVFHIWLHPWSLLLYNSLERDLKSFLALVAEKRDKGKLTVMTMGELADHLGKLSQRGNT